MTATHVAVSTHERRLYRMLLAAESTAATSPLVFAICTALPLLPSIDFDAEDE